jgi:hypothetical protein
MTNKKSLIEKIKNQLASLLSSERTFASIQCGEMTITTKDEEFTVGSEVYTVDQDGNNIPLADGEYKADDGTMMVVSGGKLTEIKKEVEKEEKEEVETEVEAGGDYMKKEKKEEEKSMGSMEERMAKIEMAIMEMAKKMEEFGKKEEVIMEKFSKLSTLPAEEKITTGNVEFKSIEDKKSGAKVDIQAIREAIRKNR